MLGGDRRSPTLDADGRASRTRPRRAGRGAPRPRVDADDARRWRQPGGLVEVDGARTRPRRPRRRRRTSTGSPRATTTSGSRSRRRSRGRPTRGGRRSRRSRTPRAASSASTRASGCSCRWPLRLGGRGGHADGHHPPRAWTAARDRARTSERGPSASPRPARRGWNGFGNGEVVRLLEPDRIGGAARVRANPARLSTPKARRAHAKTTDEGEDDEGDHREPYLLLL